jgi:hypothetical protein
MRVRGQNGAALLEIPLRGNVLLDEYNFKHYNRRRLNPKMIICRMPNDYRCSKSCIRLFPVSATYTAPVVVDSFVILTYFTTRFTAV